MKENLIIVSPTYNEAKILEEFIADWVKKLRELHITFEFRIYNDGSTDNTNDVLFELKKKYSELQFYTKSNSGHGPTIFEAYKECIGFSWIFQIDSDHELSVNTFEQIWLDRFSFDILLGVRTHRKSPLFRRFLTKTAALLIRLFWRKKLTDVNIPYRLVRSEKMMEFLLYNRVSSFAPNALMTAFALKSDWRIKTFPVEFSARKKASLTGFSFYMLKGAANCTWQLVRLLLEKKKTLAKARGHN